MCDLLFVRLAVFFAIAVVLMLDDAGLSALWTGRFLSDRVRLARIDSMADACIRYGACVSDGQ